MTPIGGAGVWRGREGGGQTEKKKGKGRWLIRRSGADCGHEGPGMWRVAGSEMGETIKDFTRLLLKSHPSTPSPRLNFHSTHSQPCRRSSSHPHPAAALTRTANQYRTLIHPPHTRDTTPFPHQHHTTTLLAFRVVELTTLPPQYTDGVAVTVAPVVATLTTVPTTGTTLTVTIVVPIALPPDTVPTPMYAFLSHSTF